MGKYIWACGLWMICFALLYIPGMISGMNPSPPYIRFLLINLDGGIIFYFSCTLDLADTRVTGIEGGVILSSMAKPIYLVYLRFGYSAFY